MRPRRHREQDRKHGLGRALIVSRAETVGAGARGRGTRTASRPSTRAASNCIAQRIGFAPILVIPAMPGSRTWEDVP